MGRVQEQRGVFRHTVTEIQAYKYKLSFFFFLTERYLTKKEKQIQGPYVKVNVSVVESLTNNVRSLVSKNRSASVRHTPVRKQILKKNTWISCSTNERATSYRKRSGRSRSRQHSSWPGCPFENDNWGNRKKIIS